MCVCVHISIYIYIDLFIYIYIYIHIHICILVFRDARSTQASIRRSAEELLSRNPSSSPACSVGWESLGGE